MINLLGLSRCTNNILIRRIPIINNKVSSLNFNYPNNKANFYQTRYSQTGTNNKKSEPNDKDKDPSYKYKITFKKDEIIQEYKMIYKLYGPLFIACHIGVSLCSLGTFCSLVWLTVDLTKLVPEFMLERVGSKVMNATGEGGKFVLAYAVHKVILPVRLGVSIYLTKFLAPKLKKLPFYKSRLD